MPELTLDPKTTALVAIDLQHGIVAMNTAPHASADVVARNAEIARALRAAGGTVVFVRVTQSADGKDALKPTTDAAPAAGGARPANWAELVPELGVEESDVVVTKRQWGAFYGTDLELQLRRRGVKTILLTGIATNIGVESTARDAFERGFDQVFVEDATASASEAAHKNSFGLFPRMGRVRSTAEVLAALKGA